MSIIGQWLGMGPRMKTRLIDGQRLREMIAHADGNTSVGLDASIGTDGATTIVVVPISRLKDVLIAAGCES